MSTHDESLIDKVKSALGFGDDGHHDHASDEAHVHDDLATDRPEGWAGVDTALADDPTTDGGDVANRPAGPDYAAADPTYDDTLGEPGVGTGTEPADATYGDDRTIRPTDPDDPRVS